MTEQRRKDALKYIEGQLEYGYIDLGMNDQDELEIIREAINLLKAIDKFNSIGCTSFRLTPEEIREAIKQMETADDVVGCAVNRVIESSNNNCSGCVYEDADGSTEDIGNCVCCSRNYEFAKNDYYQKK